MVYSYFDRRTRQWKKGTWTKTIRNAARRGAAESLVEERLQTGANRWRKGLFEERDVDEDGDEEMLGKSSGCASQMGPDRIWGLDTEGGVE